MILLISLNSFLSEVLQISKIKSSKFVFVLLEILLKIILENLDIIIDNMVPIRNIEIAKSKFSVNNFISNKFLKTNI